jgi:bacteriophage N4 adsorption protein B
MDSWAAALDAFLLAIAGPISIYIVLSGMDDLFIDLLWVYYYVTGRSRVATPSEDALNSLPQRRIAIMIPAWKEYEVIQQMLEHNAAALHYENCDFFVGVYPNDSLTLSAVELAAQRVNNVHWAMTPHPGPTSKGDCLNWIYQNILEYEQTHGVQFDVFLMHDAEDIIHPESLRYINFHAGDYGFIQVPVLALQTPLANLTHGVYCDEFAETQSRDLPVRQHMGVFVPSAGVGTAMTRAALDELAFRNQNRVFEPDSLTEDYEMGLRLHESGCRQMFLPVQIHDESETWVATREYFPKIVRTAIRQRTRWITGISLQTWARHGWAGPWRQKYWFWRDRKGLIGSPLGLVTSLLFLYGCWSGMWWSPAAATTLGVRLMPVTTALLAVRLAIRMASTARIYGPALAYLAPVRVLWGNWINGVATVRAVYKYTLSRIRKERLAWFKTEHQYPSREALVMQRRRLGDLLVKQKVLTRDQVEQAAATQPKGVRLGEYLLQLAWITEEELYAALSLQQQVPLVPPKVDAVPVSVGRSLPAEVIRHHRVLPFRIAEEGMEVCSPEPPDAETAKVIAGFTKLEVRFFLAPPGRFRELLVSSGNDPAPLPPVSVVGGG